MDEKAYRAGARRVWVETATGEQGGNAEIIISPNTSAWPSRVVGRYLYELVTVPGTGEETPTAYTGEVKDALGRTILEIPTRSTTAVETIFPPDVIGRYPLMLTDWEITLTGIGEGKKVTIHAIFA